MLLSRKSISEVSESIFREQRELRKERLLASPALIIGFCGFMVILILAVFVPLFHPVDPDAMEVTNRLLPPGDGYLLGTDEFGRDLFVRVMYGARVSLWVGGCVAAFSCVLGIIIGIYASYFKILDQVLMRICDGLIAIPGILLAIALISALGTSSWNVIVALTVVYTPSVARTVRASAMVIREQAYVEAAKVQGFSNFRILWRMILPGVISPLTGAGVLHLCAGDHLEASLSFLGAGIRRRQQAGEICSRPARWYFPKRHGP